MELIGGKKNNNKDNYGEYRGCSRDNSRNDRKKKKEKLEKENTDELKTKKIGEAIMKIKINKAAGIDEIQIEAWRYGGDKIKKGKSWKEDLVGGTNSRELEVEHHSVSIQKEIKKRLKIIGISLLCSAYKIYTEILRNRLEVEVKKKE